jgi:hypothetical protein
VIRELLEVVVTKDRESLKYLLNMSLITQEVHATGCWEVIHLQCLLRHIINGDVEGSEALFLETDWIPLSEGEAKGCREVDTLSAEALLTAPALLVDFFFLVIVTVENTSLVEISAGRA